MPLAIVIPTRNRAQLAIDACNSLLNQSGSPFEVFVSDNSTEPDQIRRLADYCAAADRDRLTYLRPPEPLPQPTHWDWALGEALRRSHATHFTIHYDRRITKPGHLALLDEVLTRFPDTVVTWTVDQILREGARSTVWQTPWTGAVYLTRTARVVEMTYQATIREMGQAFPLLSNCAVPRATLLSVRERFGDICDSGGPDSCFTYRFCATHEHYLHFDRPLGIVYASHRSTGIGYLRGAGGDFDDFVQSWRGRPWMDAAPIPGLNLGMNLMFHEYELVRRATNHPAFKPIQKEGYLRDLSRGLEWVEGPRRVELQAILVQHGLNPQTEVVERRNAAGHNPVPRGFRRAIPKGIRDLLRPLVRWLRQRVVLFRAEHLHYPPEHICGFKFRADQEALESAIAYPRRADDHNPYLDPLNPVPLPPGDSGVERSAGRGVAGP